MGVFINTDYIQEISKIDALMTACEENDIEQKLINY